MLHHMSIRRTFVLCTAEGLELAGDISMDMHSYELDAMNLLFNHRYIPFDYPQPEDYWPVKFEDNTQEQ